MYLSYGDRKNLLREPPADAQRALRDAFPECYYEWMPRSQRWSVKRRIPSEEIDREVKAGRVREVDIEVCREERRMQGLFEDDGSVIIHAFTVQGPNGEYMEPGEHVIEAMRRCDTKSDKGYPGGMKGALRDVMNAQLKRETELNKWFADQIEQATESFDYRLRQNPTSASYRPNPKGQNGQHHE